MQFPLFKHFQKEPYDVFKMVKKMINDDANVKCFFPDEPWFNNCTKLIISVINKFDCFKLFLILILGPLQLYTNQRSVVIK